MGIYLWFMFKKRNAVLKTKHRQMLQQSCDFGFKFLRYEKNKMIAIFKESIYIANPVWYLADLFDVPHQSIENHISFKFVRKSFDSEFEKYKKQLLNRGIHQVDWVTYPDIEIIDDAIVSLNNELSEIG